MGKWGHLKNFLPRFVDPNLVWQEKVEAAKAPYIGLSVTELARQYGHYRGRKQDREDEVSLINIEMEALSQMLIQELEVSEFQKVTLTSGETGYLQDEPYPSVESQELLLKWVRRKRLQRMLTLNWQTMSALTKEALSAGKPTPDGVKVFLKTKFVLRGSGKAAGEDG